MALFFSAATAAGAFGGLLAFGINKMGMSRYCFLTRRTNTDLRKQMVSVDVVLGHGFSSSKDWLHSSLLSLPTGPSTIIHER